MGFYNNNNKLLEILYSGETLILRRYDTNQVYVDYLLFDKMLYKSYFWPKFKVYITAHFIWIEHGEYGYTTPNTHSPLFWGLDINGKTNISSFLKKSSNAKIQLYQNHIDSKYNGEDIQIYAFKLSKLIKYLKNYTSNNYSRARQFNNKNNLNTKVLATKKDIVNRTFSIYPNSVKDELFINLSSNKNTKIELIDMRGNLLYKAEISGNYKHTIPIKDFNINSGMIFIRETTAKGVNIRKIIVNK